MKVAHEFIVLEDAEVLTQHPVGEGLHEFGGLIAVKTGDQSGLGQLGQGGDKLAEIGGLVNLDLFETHVQLPAQATGFSLEGTDFIVPSGGAGGGDGLGFIGDVDDEVALIVAGVGGALLDH